VKYLALVAIQRDENTIKDFNIDHAIVLVTLKLVGFAEVVHVLLDRLAPDSSIVLFGGQAKDRPYPGSTTVSTVNGGVSGMVKTLAWELAPIRVNAIHPGITGDSPYWDGKPRAVLEGHRSKTITQKLATMDEIVAGTRFLLENESVDGHRSRRRQRPADVLMPPDAAGPAGLPAAWASGCAPRGRRAR
jgi:NAD(P)-dependent dehydrogenase (short-subunit alcohol dehydrogenase family)